MILSSWGEQAQFNLEIKKKSGLSTNPDIHYSKVFSSGHIGELGYPRHIEELGLPGFRELKEAARKVMEAPERPKQLKDIV